MTTLSQSNHGIKPRRRLDPPPLENGDHMNADEFLRAWRAMPEVKKAELINGVVYVEGPYDTIALMPENVRRGLDPDWPRDTPPLENGDHLDAREFLRRWEAMPGLKHAELIHGVVYMAAAVRHEQHGRPHNHLAFWLGYYTAHTPGLDCGDNSTILLDAYEAPQPDELLRIPDSAGGQTYVNKNGYLEGAPELVAEVSASTMSLDLNKKAEAYLQYGVKEFIVWRVHDRVIDWFVRRDNEFVALAADRDGFLKSREFPGLWLDVGALVAGDLGGIMKVIDQGAKTAEHAAFVKRLAQKA